MTRRSKSEGTVLGGLEREAPSEHHSSCEFGEQVWEQLPCEEHMVTMPQAVRESTSCGMCWNECLFRSQRALGTRSVCGNAASTLPPCPQSTY